MGDAGTEIEVVAGASPSPVTVTVPTNASVPFPIGTTINIRQMHSGTDQVTIGYAGGVTVNTANGLHTRTQYSTVSLYKDGTNTWVLSGDTST